MKYEFSTKTKLTENEIYDDENILFCKVENDKIIIETSRELTKEENKALSKLINDNEKKENEGYTELSDHDKIIFISKKLGLE